ncbi:MAG: ribosome recycling factor [Chthoniobacterales bacterium]
MSYEEALLEAEADMENAVSFMQQEFSGIRTGKASPALVENLDVEAYDGIMKLKQLALISSPEPRLLVIQPYDIATVKSIERAISASKLGISPVVDGKLVRLPIPELSEERRLELVKTIKQISEETKVRIRAARRNAMDAAKKAQKAAELTEDDLKIAENEIQKITDTYTKKIEQYVDTKEQEIMRV